MTSISPEQLLFGHTSEETAYLVSDYPYSWKLRCKIRYWIETTKSGDRFCSQTTNPKVEGEKWNKPKKSTYSDVGVMFLNEEDHVRWTGIHAHAQADKIEEFEALVGENLSDVQRKRMIQIKAVAKIMSKVTYKITSNTQTAEERAAEDVKQEEIKRTLNRAINHEIVTQTREAGL